MEFKVNEDCWQLQIKGMGDKFLLLFHGYGQHCEAFHHWEELLADEYTFLHVDLAYHGAHETSRFEPLFHKEYCKIWLNRILACSGAKQVDILAYSIGARVALHTASVMPEKIRKIVLLAPDGLPVLPSYRFITNTWPGVLLFKAFVKIPQIALSGIFLAELMRIFPKRTADFYRFEISSLAKRKQLFNTWMFYRECRPKPDQLKALQERIPGGIHVILGQNDAVLPPLRSIKFLEKHEIHWGTFKLDIGHNLLSEKAVRKFVQSHTNEKSGFGAA
jgi:pimeloyl-ACP methyl ester carboxylesterase